MTAQKQPTLTQWKRRALHAEAQLEALKKVREHEYVYELQEARINAAAIVALREAREAIEWAIERGVRP